MTQTVKAPPLFDLTIVRGAVVDSFQKLSPRQQAKNPVIFVVAVGAALTTTFLMADLLRGDTTSLGFKLQIALWLWFTVLFANFAEAMAVGRGKAQADSLRRAACASPALKSTVEEASDIAQTLSMVRSPKRPA